MLRGFIKFESFQRISLEWFVPLAYIIAVGFIALLPDLSQEYFVDENAFIVHSVQAAITATDIKPIIERPLPEQAAGPILKQWLVETWSSPAISIRVFRQDLVYAILRSRRSNGEDSIVLVIPYYEFKEEAISGLHIAAALIKYLTNVKWLAKDVIVVFVPDNRRELLAQWVDAYHSEYIDRNETNALPLNRAGSIRAAYVLDVPPASSFQALTIVSGTSQGVLANFDTVAIVQYMMKQHNIELSISDLYNSSMLCSSSSYLGWLNRWRPMLRFMADAASGLHAGLHGCFIEYNIDALSLVATGVSTDTRVRQALFISLTLALEEIVRATTNLIEKLHHSSFIYILTGTNHLVTFIIFYWCVLVLGSPWALVVLQRIPNDLPLSTMMPAFHTFMLIMSWSISLQYAPHFFDTDLYATVLLWVAISVIYLTFLLTSLPKDISWFWLQSIMALFSMIFCIPFSLLNFTLTVAFVFATMPLILIRPRVSGGGGLHRNAILLILFSPIIPILSTSLFLGLPPSSLVSTFISGVSLSDHQVYTLFFSQYLPNFMVAAYGACISPDKHLKTD